MPGLGISRVTDITRMDRLGVPVYASVRPRGLSLRVHAGKGLLHAEARIGALMEAIEFAVLEHVTARGADGRMRVHELMAQLPDGLGIVDFAPRMGVPVLPEQWIDVVRCEDLGGGPPVWLPAELVLLPWAPDDGPPLFGWTSNGLASGNSLEEATLHALFELLERDAMAINTADEAAVRLDNADLPEPFCTWARQWQQLGVELIVRYVPNDFGLPCFDAYVFEPASADVNLAIGSALHFDREIALARAVSEAAQSRLSFIHGARDDIVHFYAKYVKVDDDARRAAEAQLLASLRATLRPMVISEVPDHACSTPADALAELLQRLSRLGFSRVFRCRLGLADHGVDLQGLHVVKVVVPRCEVAPSTHLRMGPRLLERVLGRV